jgi:hypothetical protein
MQDLQHFKIDKISLYEQQSIMVAFNNEWIQENIDQLTALLMDQCGRLKTLEIITGADRAYMRLEYQGDFFTLQFECNSQSCWIEAEDETSRQALPQLYHEFQVTN